MATIRHEKGDKKDTLNNSFVALFQKQAAKHYCISALNGFIVLLRHQNTFEKETVGTNGFI